MNNENEPSNPDPNPAPPANPTPPVFPPDRIETHGDPGPRPQIPPRPEREREEKR